MSENFHLRKEGLESSKYLLSSISSSISILEVNLDILLLLLLTDSDFLLLVLDSYYCISGKNISNFTKKCVYVAISNF